jgi:outer membrane protein assembly factor BamA
LQTRNLFNNDFIKSQIQIIPSGTYTREAYNRTINQLNKLGVWQNINISSEINDSLNKIDYALKLQPAKKQYFSIDLEGSSIVNTSQLVQVGSGRVGLANNFTLRNRNIGKKAIQLENSLRTGIEFNNFKRFFAKTSMRKSRLSHAWFSIQ